MFRLPGNSARHVIATLPEEEVAVAADKDAEVSSCHYYSNIDPLANAVKMGVEWKRSGACDENVARVPS